MMKGAKCTNFQKTTLAIHASLYDHQMLLQAPDLRQDLETVKKIYISKQDAAMKVPFITVHFLTVEDISLVIFQAFVDFFYITWVMKS